MYTASLQMYICGPSHLQLGLFTFQYYEMSYGLNIEMHKQVRPIIFLVFAARCFSTAWGGG